MFGTCSEPGRSETGCAELCGTSPIVGLMSSYLAYYIDELDAKGCIHWSNSFCIVSDSGVGGQFCLQCWGTYNTEGSNCLVNQIYISNLVTGGIESLWKPFSTVKHAKSTMRLPGVHIWLIGLGAVRNVVRNTSSQTPEVPNVPNHPRRFCPTPYSI